ncbi:MAG: DUF1700 domain-containing protein [Eubacterium sp.]|jgi:uncharacterized membrane protein|nr:DUF1700 domain-containing protein [Eubacterium sp.]
MMVPETKELFLKELESELTRRGVADTADIINDFEQHFIVGLENGKSEADVCESLGDIGEIASQYFSAPAVYSKEESTKENEKTKTGEQSGSTGQKRYEESGIKLEIGNMVACVLLDVLVLSWALGVAISIVFSILVVSISLFAGSISVFFGHLIVILYPFTTISMPFGWTASLFASIALLSLAGLAFVLFIASLKLFIKVIKMIIDWHAKIFTGKAVFKKREVQS